MRKVIISLAPAQAGTSVDAVKLAEDVEKSVKLGAAMCHLHCRKPDGSLTPDISYMSECFDEILKRTDVVVRASTGGVSDMKSRNAAIRLIIPRQRAHLNGGSTNLGEAVLLILLMISATAQTLFIRVESFRKQKFLILECYITWQW